MNSIGREVRRARRVRGVSARSLRVRSESDGILSALLMRVQLDDDVVIHHRTGLVSDGERMMAWVEPLRRAAGMLLSVYLPADVELAASAYDAGLACGLLGREAAITQGLVERYRCVCVRSASSDVDPLGMAARLRELGQMHGRELLEQLK
ncbi:hypothetical protein ACT2E5_05530 [Burkholderia vietnamiensis]|uniref:hypothetical protein n=1 Tax=Burkholderia vietnamiensis TaxID=60552 RepID=UPI00402A7204